MAITRVWQAGLEIGSIAEFSGTTGTMECSSALAKTGTYSLKPGNNAAPYAYAQIPNTRQIRIGFWWNCGVAANENTFCYARTLAAATIFSIQQCYTGRYMTIDIGNVNQAIAYSVFDTLTWMHIGIDCKIDSSAGWIVVYKDGKEILRKTGNTGNVDIGQICFGIGDNVGNNITYFDDLYIDDTTGEASEAVVPMKRFYFTPANGNGNYSQLTGSDGNQTDNYALVDEIPYNDTDYVQATSADQIDSYACAGKTIGAGEKVIAVIPIAIAKRTGTTEQIAIGLRSTSDVVGSDQVPTAANLPYWDRQITKPGGGDWDQTAIDNLEPLIKSRGTY